MVLVPVVGLFGQASVAEAAAQEVQDQPFGYARPLLRAYEHDFMPMLDSILKARYNGQIGGDVASRLVHTLLDALIAVSNPRGASAPGAIQAFISQVRMEERALPEGLTRELLNGAQKHI